VGGVDGGVEWGGVGGVETGVTGICNPGGLGSGGPGGARAGLRDLYLELMLLRRVCVGTEREREREREREMRCMFCARAELSQPTTELSKPSWPLGEPARDGPACMH
jgi:hypothetical protein